MEARIPLFEDHLPTGVEAAGMSTYFQLLRMTSTTGRTCARTVRFEVRSVRSNR
jgi:hypothetical protein